MDIDNARLEAELDRLWQGLRQELGSEPEGLSLPPRSHRHRWVDSLVPATGRRMVAAVALALAGLTAAGTAMAASLVFEHARQGTFSTGADAKIAGPGEWLEMSAPDMPQVVRELTRDIPFPPGYQAWQNYTFNVWLTSSEQSRTSESAARAQVASQAICSWADYWVAADRSGDRAARRRATRVLVKSLHWPAVTTLDPDPDPLGEIGNHGEPTPTYFGYLPGVVRAVQGDDADAVARSLFPSGDTHCIVEQFRALDGERLLQESAR
jgi:hypothetical protein